MWIRAQEGGLYYCRRISSPIYRKEDTVSAYQIRNVVSDSMECVDYDILGEYATEERAMEVLDEIQERIVRVKASKNGWFESKDIYVYEMPEE